MWRRCTWRLWGLLGLCICLGVLGVGAEPKGAVQKGLGSSGRKCQAVVVYSAITGDPEKAKRTSLFRGFVRVRRSAQAGQVGENATLEWTFTEQETIEAGRNVFREDSVDGNEMGPIDFTSNTKRNFQTVTLKFPPQNKPVGIGFVATKGQQSRGTPSALQTAEPSYTVGLPRDMKLNALECNRVGNEVGEEFESVQEDEAVSPSEGEISLEYLPIEFANMRFYYSYASNFAIFSIRLKNVGKEPINLSDLVLEYWFDGGNAQDKAPHELFKSRCMTSSNINCDQFDVSIKPGLEQVSGAHYKMEIAFQKTAGVLEPEPGLSIIPAARSDPSEEPKAPKYMVEAIMNITSMQFFAQMDVTEDYSFLNTTILTGATQLPRPLLPRRYEVNPNFPVLKNGKIVFGRRPKSGSAKVSTPTDVKPCRIKKQTVQQCAVRARYCCIPREP